MNVALDNPRTMKMKNGLTALSFTLILHEGENIQVIPNFRLMDGLLHAPAIQLSKTRQYIPIYYASNPVLDQIYEQLFRSGWLERYNLLLAPRKEAGASLLLTADISHRIAPGYFE